MLNAIIQFALQRRAVILCVALAAIVLGSIAVQSLPIDVLPDLTRPRVTIITECMGMAPEEVEREVTVPLETAVNGAAGVIAVRSKSDVGLSVINVEFDWGTDIYRSRQIVNERMSLAREQIPKGLQPRLGPLSSLLGQIMLIGMWSETGETGPLEVRTQADWVVKKRLQQIAGISEVITMGGGLKQYHVLVDIHELHKYEISLADIENALRQSNNNVNGGYVDRNSREFLVRGIGRVNGVQELRRIVVRDDSERAILLENVATIEPIAQAKRGDSTINGKPGVVLTIQKQPTADTRLLSDEIVKALNELRPSLPEDVRLEVTYQQREFIDHSVGNVIERVLRDGSILVVLVLFLFLFNVRTTLITLTAIPVSILVTALVFQYLELSINVMTLGGIAIALGELVDDAIVDVENIFRRLKQNSRAENPRPIIKVIFEASVEVRNAIIISTLLVIIVFSPLFALSGISGRMFIPLGVAYIVSIVASTIVSLTLTPVLSYFLLGRTQAKSERSDSWVVRGLKIGFAPLIRISMTRLGFSLLFLSTILSVAVCGILATRMGQEWIPKFDEGSMQMNLFAEPGTSLKTSLEISGNANKELAKLVYSEDNPDGFIRYFTGRTGRAENDEHVMGVNTTEYTISLIENHGKTRKEIIEILEDTAALVPDVGSETDQPIAHMISHLISGSTAQIAVKLFGDDLDTLVRKGAEIRDAISEVKGIKPPKLEQQQLIPQLRIEPDYEQLAAYKLTLSQVFEMVEMAMQGRVVSKMVEQERTFDIVIRFPESYRENFEELGRIPIELPDGESIPLATVANVYEYGGPNTINREVSRRRIIVRVYTSDSDLATAVADIKKVVEEKVELPEGYFIQYGGQFEAQQEATKQILILSVVALMIVFVILYSSYSSFNIVFQILIALPIAFVGGILALSLTGQLLTTSAMVGFISLGGIAARNGLLLVSTYLDNPNAENEITKQEILEGSLERMTPVLMTALTTGIGLLPLIFAGSLPGREILYPVATVIVGGLITSTICEFLIRPGLFFYLGPTKKLAKEETLT